MTSDCTKETTIFDPLSQVFPKNLQLKIETNLILKSMEHKNSEVFSFVHFNSIK